MKTVTFKKMGCAVFAAFLGMSLHAEGFGGFLKSAAKEALSENTGGAETLTVNPSLPYADQLKEALEKVSAIPQDWPAFADEYMSAEKLKELASDMNTVDTSKFPADLKDAYSEVAQSTDTLAKTAEKMPSKENFKSKDKLKSALGGALTSADSLDKASEVTAELKNCFSNLNQSRQKLFDIAKKYVK